MLHRHRSEHLWLVAALRLLTLTGARISQILNLKCEEFGEIDKDGASARLEDSKAGPRTIWLGPETARLLAALPRPEGVARVFPKDLTSDRLYTFWVGIRADAGLLDLRIHDTRHTWASQGVMNGVGITTVGRLLGHRRRETTAIYAHLDDGALRDAASEAAAVVARAIGYRTGPPQLPAETDDAEDGTALDRANTVDRRTMPTDPLYPPTTENRSRRSDRAESNGARKPSRRRNIDWLGDSPFESNSESVSGDCNEPSTPRDPLWF